MRGEGMEALDKRILASLPVAAHALADMHRLEAVLETPILPFSRHTAEILFQWRCIVIVVDEDETVPDFDADLGQREGGLFEMREIPLGWHPLQIAVQAPSEKV